MARVKGIALVLVGVAFVPWGILKLTSISRGYQEIPISYFVRLFTAQATNPLLHCSPRTYKPTQRNLPISVAGKYFHHLIQT